MITGRAEANANVDVYMGSKKIASTKANSKGDFKFSLKAMKKNTKLTIYAYDAAMNKSKATMIIVK